MPFGGGVLEVREVMEPYVSFSDDTILSSVTPLEGSLEDQLKTTICESVQPASADPPVEEATAEEAAPHQEASGGTQSFPNPR